MKTHILRHPPFLSLAFLSLAAFMLLVNTPGRGSNSSSLRVGIDVPVGATTSVRGSTRDAVVPSPGALRSSRWPP